MTRADIPTIEQCSFDTPPVPRPLYVVWHPESDDCWNMMGEGQTKLEAYQDMINKHDEWLEDMRDKIAIDSQPWDAGE
jgi:hypothetical protein